MLTINWTRMRPLGCHRPFESLALDICLAIPPKNKPNQQYRHYSIGYLLIKPRDICASSPSSMFKFPQPRQPTPPSPPQPHRDTNTGTPAPRPLPPCRAGAGTFPPRARLGTGTGYFGLWVKVLSRTWAGHRSARHSGLGDTA